MMSTVLVVVLMFFSMPGLDSALSPSAPEISSTFCNHDPDIETFAASLYTALVVQFGFENVAAIEVSGADAAMAEYNTVLQILLQQGLCDADFVAFSASRPLTKIPSLPLAVYLEKTAHGLGVFLKNMGLLKCSTAIPLSFDFFKLVQNAFVGLNPYLLPSYMQAVIPSLVEMLSKNGLPLDKSAKSLANLFDKEFNYNCTNI